MKKFISCLLTFVLILSLMAPLSVCADGTDATTVTPDTSWYSNTGTSSAPVTCYIEDEADLLGFGSLLRTTDFQYEIIVLKNDITLNQEWNAEYNSSVAFWGTFDGQGHTITGLKKTNPTSNYGFIPNAGGCTIKNVTFTNVSITGSTGATGAVIGFRGAAQDVHFENVHVQEGTLSASNELGGLIGSTGKSFTLYFTDCSFKGTLTHTGGTDKGVGGLAGSVYAHIEATGCYVKATIQAKGRAGGVVGSANDVSTTAGDRSLTVTESYITGSIVSTGERVGGIGGRCGKVSLTDVVVAADVQNGTDYVAAFTAQCLNSAEASFTRCVFTGNVTSTGSNAGIFTGDGRANVKVNECLLLASSAVTLPAASFANATSCAVTAKKLYCDTTVCTGLASTAGVENINGLALDGINGAKNLPDLFSEANRVNWTITDTCPMPSNALKGCNVANLEMLAFQTNPETVTGKYDIRFVGFINSTNYKEAGVIVKIGNKEATIPATHVYNSINEKLGNTTNSVGITEYGYETEDGHFLAIVLTDVPADVTVFTVTPYVVTNDGITVYGVSGTASVTVTQ